MTAAGILHSAQKPWRLKLAKQAAASSERTDSESRRSRVGSFFNDRVIKDTSDRPRSVLVIIASLKATTRASAFNQRAVNYMIHDESAAYARKSCRRTGWRASASLRFRGVPRIVDIHCIRRRRRPAEPRASGSAHLERLLQTLRLGVPSMRGWRERAHNHYGGQ